MAPPQAIPILGQMEDTSLQVSHLWSGGCHIWTRAAGLTSIMAEEVTGIVTPFWPPGVYFSPTRIMAPPPGHSNLVSDEVYISSSPLLMICWWLPYLAKGPMPDFNSGPGNISNIDWILALQHLLETNLNNSPPPPPPAIPILCQMEYTICSGLLLMVSWWVPYLPKGCRPDFNNGLGGDTNSGLVLAPRRLFESDHNNLVWNKVYICSSLLFMISWW